MSEVSARKPRKFISFRHLCFESSAYNLPKERESDNPHNAAETDEINTVVLRETSNSPSKVLSISQNVPMSSESVT